MIHAESSTAPAYRMGLMGGSFDPVHAAHLRLARTALEALSLDQVRWIPVGQPWQKSRHLAPAEHRLAMVRLAIHGEPRFVVDPIEIERSGPSYTLETVQTLQRCWSGPTPVQWFLIIGQDQYTNLPTWHGWQELLACLTLAVACRGAAPLMAPGALQDHPHRVETLPMPPMQVSSTDIRNRLAHGESPESLGELMADPAVARYIANHQLYAPGAPC